MTIRWTVDTTGHYWDTSLLSYSFWHFHKLDLVWVSQSISSSRNRVTSQSASTLAFFAWGWSSAFLFLGVSISITSFSTSSISSSSSRSMTSLLWNKNAFQSFLLLSVSWPYLIFLGWDNGDFIAEFYWSFQYWATSFWSSLQQKMLKLMQE